MYQHSEAIAPPYLDNFQSVEERSFLHAKVVRYEGVEPVAAVQYLVINAFGV